jgi:DNA modification methylase
MKFDPMLAWGNFKKSKLTFDYIYAPVISGFLNKSILIHPHPKPEKLYYQILKQLKPNNILDTCVGSGISVKECKVLGIPYLGYEINEKYKVDIDYNLANAKIEKPLPETKQIGMGNFLNKGVVNGK